MQNNVLIINQFVKVFHVCWFTQQLPSQSVSAPAQSGGTNCRTVGGCMFVGLLYKSQFYKCTTTQLDPVQATEFHVRLSLLLVDGSPELMKQTNLQNKENKQTNSILFQCSLGSRL